MSEDLWTNPTEYKPSRFLEDNNNNTHNNDRELHGGGSSSDNSDNEEHSNIQSTAAKVTSNKTFKKPKHFQPFSMGRRMCMGYKIVQNVSYSIIASLLQHFTFDALTLADIETLKVTKNAEIPLGMLALPPQSFSLRLTKRQVSSSHSLLESSLPLTNSPLKTRA